MELVAEQSPYSSIITYFEMMTHLRESMGPRPERFAYHCIEEYILKNGKAYTSAPLTREERGILNHVLDHCPVKRFQIKQCFYNSQTLILSDFSGTLTYVEGYVVREGLGIPVQHGWIDINGKVIDLTLRTDSKKRGVLGNRVLGAFPEGRLYYGAKFNTQLVRHMMLDRGWAGSLLDDWENDFPLLKK